MFGVGSMMLYLTKFKAMAECSGLGNVIERSVVIISGADFTAAVDKTTAPCEMFKDNHKTGVLFVLGQESPHGLAMFQESLLVTLQTLKLNVTFCTRKGTRAGRI